jgi:hypothetical protein
MRGAADSVQWFAEGELALKAARPKQVLWASVAVMLKTVLLWSEQSSRRRRLRSPIVVVSYP